VKRTNGKAAEIKQLKQ